VAIARELEALGVDIVVIDQAADATTPAGSLLFHVLGAITEFERRAQPHPRARARSGSGYAERAADGVGSLGP